MPSILPPATTAAPGRPPMEAGPFPKAPFPEDTPAHPLLVVDFLKIAAGDEAEVDTLFQACSTLGFFYLKVSLETVPLLSAAKWEQEYEAGADNVCSWGVVGRMAGVFVQNFGFENLVEPMFEMGQDAFKLPLDELLEYEMGDGGRTAGYKKVSP